VKAILCLVVTTWEMDAAEVMAAGLNPVIGQRGCMLTAIMLVRKYKPEAETCFGQNVKNCVNNGFKVGVDDSEAVTQGEHNRVGSPQDDGEDGKTVVQPGDVVRLQPSRLAAGPKKGVEDEDQEYAGEDKPAPHSQGPPRVQPSYQPSDDHRFIHKHDGEDVQPGETGEQTEIEQKKRSCQSPINITSPENLSEKSDLLALNSLVALVDPSVTSFSGHRIVAESCDAGDQGGKDVESPIFLLMPGTKTNQSDSRDEEHDKGNPLRGMTKMADASKVGNGMRGRDRSHRRDRRGQVQDSF